MNWTIKRPFVPVTLVYVAGILLADQIVFPPANLLAVAGFVALLTLVWGKQRALLVWPLIFLVGTVNLTWQTAILAPQDLRVIMGSRTELALLRGRLAETPYHRVYDQNAEPAHRTLARIEVDEIKLKNQPWQPALGRVAISAAGILPNNFHAGQMVEVAGVMRPPQAPQAEGLFDYRNFLRRAGIYYQLQSGAVTEWKLIPPVVEPPISERFFSWAKNILARDLPGDDEPLRLLWTMTLGWKSALTGEVAEPFMRSGTMHVFAILALTLLYCHF